MKIYIDAKIPPLDVFGSCIHNRLTQGLLGQGCPPASYATVLMHSTVELSILTGLLMPTMSLNVNCGHGMMTACWRRSTRVNLWTTGVEHSRWPMHVWGQGSVGTLSTPAQLCYETQMSLKAEVSKANICQTKQVRLGLLLSPQRESTGLEGAQHRGRALAWSEHSTEGPAEWRPQDEGSVGTCKNQQENSTTALWVWTRYPEGLSTLRQTT